MKSNSANRKWLFFFGSKAEPFVSFIAFIGAGAGLYWSPLSSLIDFFDKSELYSHMPLIPFVSAHFLVVGRRSIFAEVRRDYQKGAILLALGALVRLWGDRYLAAGHPNDWLCVYMLGFVIWLLGGFVFSFGVRALKHALFPLAFLVFLIPVPSFILNPFVRSLQQGSAEAAYWIFKLLGVPLYRDGFVFSLPGFTVEVAEQCSGIRSSIALFITAIVAGKLFLKSGWSRGVLALSVFPLAMFKNGLRIAALALLASYVDPRFVTNSWLHRSGGIPFFGVALLFLFPVLWGLRKRETSVGPVGAR